MQENGGLGHEAKLALMEPNETGQRHVERAIFGTGRWDPFRPDRGKSIRAKRLDEAAVRGGSIFNLRRIERNRGPGFRVGG